MLESTGMLRFVPAVRAEGRMFSARERLSASRNPPKAKS
jgi:hypothetical protein